MKRIRISEGKDCWHQIGLDVGSLNCINLCPLFVKQVNNKIHCDGDKYKYILDLQGNVHKVIK